MHRKGVVSINEVLHYISGSSFETCCRLLETAPVDSPADNLLGCRGRKQMGRGISHCFVDQWLMNQCNFFKMF